MSNVLKFKEYVSLLESIDNIDNFEIVSKKVSEYLGFGNTEIIGSGNYGCYSKLDSDKGLKITTDMREIIFASKIFKKDFVYIAKCYDFFKIEQKDSSFNKPLYGIVVENLEDIGDDIKVSDYDFCYDLVFIYEDYKHSFESLKDLYIDTNYDIFNLYTSMIGMKKECESLFSSFGFDLDEVGNIGKSKNYDTIFKLQDYGHSIPMVKNVEIRTIKI